MNVPLLSDSVTRDAAKAAILAYKGHRSKFDKRDREIEAIYQQIAKGRTVISVNSAIVSAGLDADGNPKLAIARADCKSVRCSKRSQESIVYVDRGSQRWEIEVPLVKPLYGSSIAAVVPTIPPQYRPASKNLRGYWLLFEADWKSIPADPYLLKRIGKDAWVVLAAWDLTEVELSVLRAHRIRQ